MTQRRRMRSGIIAVAGLAIVLAVTVPSALADQQETAVVRDRYGSPTVTIAQGERVTFSNQDLLDMHNVTAQANGTDGNPLFASRTIGPGETATVDGTQYLKTGAYSFYCSVHPFMLGTLVVSSSGSPVPRPKPLPGPHSARKVMLKGTKFRPRTLKIHVGGSVKWVWRDGPARHNVTSSSFPSSPTKSNGSYTIRFKKTGTYRYRCSIHPKMKGRIVVTPRKTR